MGNTYDLVGKFALVTGAANGIGRAIAEVLLANGCHVLIWDAGKADVAGAESALVDITQPAQIALAAAALKDNQRVDILVNDAGYLGKTTEFVSHGQSDWQQIVREVAELVAWLCTDASRFNTGAVFDMSGGRARY